MQLEVELITKLNEQVRIFIDLICSCGRKSWIISNENESDHRTPLKSLLLVQVRGRARERRTQNDLIVNCSSFVQHFVALVNKWLPVQIYWSLTVNWMKRKKTFSFYFCSTRLCVYFFLLLKRNKNIHFGFARINESIWCALLTYGCKEKVFILVFIGVCSVFLSYKKRCCWKSFENFPLFFCKSSARFSDQHNAAKLFVCEDTWYNYNAVSDKIRAYGFGVFTGDRIYTVHFPVVWYRQCAMKSGRVNRFKCVLNRFKNGLAEIYRKRMIF